jgi:hypothetical protein
MKRVLVVLSGVAVLSVLLLAVCAAAEEKAKAEAEAQPAVCSCAYCGVARATEGAAGHEEALTPMLKAHGMSPAMGMRCGMMMRMHVDPEDPAALLALSGALELTDDQVKQLEAIAKKARAEATAVLTAGQKAKLEPLAGTSMTMMEMHGQVGAMARPETGERPATAVPGGPATTLFKPGERPEGVGETK